MSNRETKMKQFAKLGIVKALEQIKCGFELETQSVNGKTWDDAEERSYDEGAIEEAVDSEYQTICDDFEENPAQLVTRYSLGTVALGRFLADKVDAIELIYPGTKAIKSDVIGRKTTSLNAGDYRFLASSFYETMNKELLPADKFLNEFFSKIRESGYATTLEQFISSYGQFEDSMRDNIRDNLDLSDFYEENSGFSEITSLGLEYEHDGSVEGPEIKSADGGVDAKEFLSTLKEVTKLDLEVDTGCSFHIHLSIPGISHQYGPALQREMYSYLLNNIDKVPEAVRERWRSGKLGEYFSPEISTGKYTFVHYHNSYHTWEFRCFGNIDNYEDGRACLVLAVKAMQHAYKVQLGLAKSLFTGDDTNAVLYELFIYSAQKSIKLSEAIKHFKENGRLRNAA